VSEEPIRPLTIPEGVRPGLEQLANLDDQRTDRLLQTIGRQEPRLAFPKFVQDVEAAVGTSDMPIEPIVQSLASLCVGREETGFGVPAFASGIAHSAELSLDIERRNRLEAILIRALELRPLIVTSKAYALLTSSERNFYQARIVTDIRPVFVDVAHTPPAAVIVHILRLGYADAIGYHELDIALDDRDISNLQRVLTRAQTKSMTLHSLLSDGPMTALDQEGL
jgi:plasmid replication initiation protein